MKAIFNINSAHYVDWILVLAFFFLCVQNIVMDQGSFASTSMADTT